MVSVQQPRMEEGTLLSGDSDSKDGTEGNSDPGKIWLQSCDPVSQAHLGKDHQEGPLGSEDHSQKPGIREELQAIHRNCQSSTDAACVQISMIFLAKESPSEFQFLSHSITLCSPG